MGTGIALRGQPCPENKKTAATRARDETPANAGRENAELPHTPDTTTEPSASEGPADFRKDFDGPGRGSISFISFNRLPRFQVTLLSMT